MKPKTLFIQATSHYAMHGNAGEPAAYWPGFDNERIIAVQCTRYAQDVVIIEQRAKCHNVILEGRFLLDSDVTDFEAQRQAIAIYDELWEKHGHEIFPDNVESEL